MVTLEEGRMNNLLLLVRLIRKPFYSTIESRLSIVGHAQKKT